MNRIVDLIALAILFFGAYVGYRKGFIKAFFDFFSGLICFIVASFSVRPFGDYLSNTVLKPFFTDFFTHKISERLSSYAEGTSPFDSAPEIVSFSARLGITQNDLQLFWEHSENRIDLFVRQFSESVSSIFSRAIGYFVSMILIIISVFFVVKLLVKIFDLIAKLPILNASNRLLGTIFGLSFGVFSVLLFASVLIVLEPFIKNSDSDFMNAFSFDKTFFLKYFHMFLIR